MVQSSIPVMSLDPYLQVHVQFIHPLDPEM